MQARNQFFSGYFKNDDAYGCCNYYSRNNSVMVAFDNTKMA